MCLNSHCTVLLSGSVVDNPVLPSLNHVSPFVTVWLFLLSHLDGCALQSTEKCTCLDFL